MHNERLSISLPEPLFRFVEEYRKTHAALSRSAVMVEALEMLRQRELEGAYREASREADPLWETVAADGLAD